MAHRRTSLPPPPRRLAPGAAVARLRELLGEPECARACASLLAGADPEDHRAELAYLGGRGGLLVPGGGWKLYWARVWGARGLLYSWAPSVEPTVVAGLDDEHWRVAEMCLKVCTLREIPAAGEAARRLATHELPRVRAQAVRALGVIGDTEHVETVRLATDDEESVVRRAAQLALSRLRERLDLAD